MDAEAYWQQEGAAFSLHVGKRLLNWIADLRTKSPNEPEDWFEGMRLQMFNLYMSAEAMVLSLLRDSLSHRVRAIYSAQTIGQRSQFFASLQAGIIAWRYRQQPEVVMVGMSATAAMFGMGNEFFNDWLDCLKECSESEKQYAFGVCAKSYEGIAEAIHLPTKISDEEYKAELEFWLRLRYRIDYAAESSMADQENLTVLERILAQAEGVTLMEATDDDDWDEDYGDEVWDEEEHEED